MFRHDRIREIPRQQHHVVRLARLQLLRREHGHVQARGVQALLERIVVDDVLDQRAVQAEVVHQRGRLGGGAVGGDRPALRLEAPQQRCKLVAAAADHAVPVAEGPGFMQPGLPLEGDEPADRFVFRPPGIADVADQRAALDFRALGVQQLQAAIGEEALERLDAVEIDVLVVDGVEQGFFVDIQQVADLEHELAAGGEQRADAFHHAAQVVDVGADVVGADRLRRTVARADALPEVGAEKIDEGLDAVVLGREVARRVHAEDPHAGALEGLEQGAVIGADLDHQVARLQRRAADDRLALVFEVLDHHRRSA